MKSRIVAIIILAVFILSSSFMAGCRSNDGTTAQTTTTTRATTATTGTTTTAATETTVEEGLHPDAGVYPIVNEKVTLSIMAPDTSGGTDIRTNAFTVWYEEYTNVHIDWQNSHADGFRQQVSVVLASGNYPDIIQDGAFTNTQLILYGSQGILVPMNEHINRYGYNLQKVQEGYPDLFKLMTAPDGNIYALPKVTDVYHVKFYQGRAWVYQPWLDKLELDLPETTEDFYNMLKAFKENDMNGNGQSDEIPFTGTWASNTVVGDRGLDMNIDRFVMNAFIFTGKDYFLMENGKIDIAYNKPEWREGLRFLNRLYNDGLLDPASFTQQPPQIAALGENPDPVIGVVPAGHPARFTKNGGERFKEYVALAPLTGPQGAKNAYYRPHNWFVGGTFVITDNCKTPDIAYRWADGFYDIDVNMRKSYGVEGVHWTKEVGDLKGLDGGPALWTTVEELYGQLQDAAWNTFGLTYNPIEIRNGQAAKDPAALEVLLFNESKNKYEGHQPDEIVPPLFFDETTANELALLDNALYTFFFESFAQFVTGGKDIDRDWEGYVRQLDALGLQRYLEIYQESYDINYSK